MLREAFEAVLNTASYYSKNGGPAMAARDATLKEIRLHLDQRLNQLASVDGEVALAVKQGGRQSSYSPTAWIRLFSPVNSPTAMNGYYLVYLFAADGSAVFLSLNQGTSEFRSGAMRPINNGDLLRSRASEARHLLDGWEGSPNLATARIDIDLGASSLPGVGTESRRRIRNYEDANILALRYPAGNIPPDDVLFKDLSSMVPLLARLYKQVFGPGSGSGQGKASGATKGGAGGRQGRQMDAETRRSIETHAEDLFAKWLADDGWDVRRVGSLRLGYDLECTRGSETMHVEVKGTVTRGEEVILTPGEVRHVLEGPCEESHALAVCADIELSFAEGVPRCHGGNLLLLNPWLPETKALTPTEYSYLVPRPSGSWL